MSISDLVAGVSSQRDQKRAELTALQMSGVTLPMSIDDIIAIEQRGDVVDLSTGVILRNGAQDRFGVTDLARKK